MSEKLYIQPRLPESRRMTRRTALRGAAWTAPAITIAVASPNVAATSLGGPDPTITAVPGVARRSSNDRNQQQVIWTLNVTAGTAMQGLSVTFSGVTAVTGLAVSCDQGEWTGNGNSTRVFSAPLQAGDQLALTVVFTRSSNGRDAKVVASFTTGSPPVNLGGCEVAVI